MKLSTFKEMVCMLKEWTRLKRRSREREERFTMEYEIVLILKAFTRLRGKIKGDRSGFNNGI